MFVAQKLFYIVLYAIQKTTEIVVSGVTVLVVFYIMCNTMC